MTQENFWVVSAGLLRSFIEKIETLEQDKAELMAALDLALSVAEDFRLSKNQAKAIIKEVSQSVSQWQKVAQGFGLEKREMNRKMLKSYNSPL